MINSPGNGRRTNDKRVWPLHLGVLAFAATIGVQEVNAQTSLPPLSQQEEQKAGAKPRPLGQLRVGPDGKPLPPGAPAPAPTQVAPAPTALPSPSLGQTLPPPAAQPSVPIVNPAAQNSQTLPPLSQQQKGPRPLFGAPPASTTPSTTPAAPTAPAAPQPLASPANPNDPYGAQALPPPPGAGSAPLGQGTAPVAAESFSQPIDLSAAGLLKEDQGGLGGQIWNGSDPLVVTKLVSTLPGGFQSPLLYDLTKRLLLTDATDPAGAGPEFLAEKGRALLRLGALGGARQLSQAIPEQSAEPLRQLKAESLFLARDGEACALVNNARTSGLTAAFWARMGAYCQAKAGDAAKAETLSNIFFEGGGQDALLTDVILVLGGDKKLELAKVAKADGMQIVMADSLARPLPLPLVQAADGAGLAHLGGSTNLSSDVKLVVYDRLAALGSLAGSELLIAYSDVKFTDAQLADPVKESAKLAKSLERARALWARAAVDTADENLLATRLGQALRYARGQAIYPVFVAALSEAMGRLPPALNHAGVSGEMARAYAVLGQGQQATIWDDAARAAVGKVPQAAHNVREAWPYLLLLRQNVMQVSAQDVQFWAGGDAENPPPPTQPNRTRALYALAGALGHSLPSHPDAPTRWAASDLEAAVQAGRKGEALLIGLNLIGDKGPPNAAVELIAEVVRALEKLGMKDEARRLAIEAAAGQGL